MKNKNEIYVLVDTPKKAMKVKTILDMFGENYSAITKEILENNSLGYPLKDFKHLTFMMGKRWSMLGGECPKRREKVSIKELRDILAVDHLKQGDIIVCKNRDDVAVGVFKEFEPNFRFEIAPYKPLSGEYEAIGGCFDRFLRYATDEEKDLLQPKKDDSALVKGRWYKHNFMYGGKDGFILFCFNGKFGEHSQYGFNHSGQWCETLSIYEYDLNSYQEASKEEVEQALIEEAIKRWFATLPSSIITYNGHRVDGLVSGRNFHRVYISDNHTTLTLDGAVIFHNGKWAQTIKEVEEIEIGDWVYYKSGEIKKLTEITQVNLNHYRKLRSAVIIKDEDLLKQLNNL